MCAHAHYVYRQLTHLEEEVVNFPLIERFRVNVFCDFMADMELATNMDIDGFIFSGTGVVTGVVDSLNGGI